MSSDCAISVLHDVLRVYDHRFLDMDDEQRGRLLQGTRQVLGEGLSDAARASLPLAYRLRAFCIVHGLDDELERLIRDEVEGVKAGAVVVGGRVYALHPYLRGVPRQDADITGEVGVEHRLDAVSWHGKKLRVRGHACIERIEARETKVEVLLRERRTGVEHRFPADPCEDGGFEVQADPGASAVGPGRWDVHVSASALGVTRTARFGTIRGDKIKTEPQRRGLDSTTTAKIYFTKGGHLAVLIRTGKKHPRLRAALRRITPRVLARVIDKHRPSLR
ncbi:hypothetical protein [Actinomadura rudentiformis]|uniref:hypothetical protein n=1 Tax=Actinomadura rudentiformis TaxID=359158 RepID=UPI00178C5994|nr:hypothetical protein [Actinomadura rudentiformis]